MDHRGDISAPQDASKTLPSKLGRLATLKVAAHRLKERYVASESSEADREYEAARRDVEQLGATYQQLMTLSEEMRKSWGNVVDVWKRMGEVMQRAGGAGGCWERQGYHGKGEGGGDEHLGEVFRKTGVLMQCLEIGGGLEGVLDDYHNYVRRVVEIGVAPLQELAPKVDKLKNTSDFCQHRLAKSRRKNALTYHSSSGGETMSNAVVPVPPSHMVPGSSSWMYNSSPGPGQGLSPHAYLEESQTYHMPLRKFRSEGSIEDAVAKGALTEVPQRQLTHHRSSTTSTALTTSPYSSPSHSSALSSSEELRRQEARAFEAKEAYLKERNVYLTSLHALRSSEADDHGKRLASLVSGFDKHFQSVCSTCHSVKDTIVSIAGEAPGEEKKSLPNGHLVVRNEDLVIDWIEICEEVELLMDLKKPDEEIKAKLRGKNPAPFITNKYKLRYMTLGIRCDSTTESSPLHCEQTDPALAEEKKPGNASETLYYLDEHQIQYIFIGGTNFRRMKQVFLDLHISLEDDEKLGIKIHRGFREAAQELYLSLKKSLRKEVPVKIVGSSLGGVVGQIIGAYLKLEGFTVMSIHAIGCPRFTDAAGAQILDECIGPLLLRVNNYHDVVRTLPRGQYKHFGRSIMLFEDGSMWNLKTPPLVEPALYTSRSKAVSSHRTIKYAKLCQQQLEKVFGVKFSDHLVEEPEDANRSNSNDSLNGSPGVNGDHSQNSSKYVLPPPSVRPEIIHTASRGLDISTVALVSQESRTKSKLKRKTSHVVARASLTALRVTRRLL